MIWGRKPATGEFVLTDGSGFEAKGYDGLATSPQMMAAIQRTRSGNRDELINLYATLFPVLEASLPANFRGYVKGDLLYMSKPPEIAGNYVFQPNTVEYKIPARSNLGQRIGNSDIGIAVHSMYSDAGDARQPLKGVTFNEVPGLMLERPATPRALSAEPAKVKQLKQLIRTDGAAISTLFNPAELRAHKITDLAKLCVDYINTKVGAPLNPATLLPEFGEWLQTKVTPSKFRNIVEYLESPSSNTPALAAAFTAFLLLHDLKMDILKQADLEHPGQEGWVMATPAGYANFVNTLVENPRKKMIEVNLDEGLQSLHPALGGTADAVLVDGNHLHVIDLKTGRVAVDAEDNKQLLTYALGAMRQLKAPNTIECTMHIYQPRVGHSKWTVSGNYLELHGRRLQSAAELALSGDAPTSPSVDACRYCTGEG